MKRICCFLVIALSLALIGARQPKQVFAQSPKALAQMGGRIIFMRGRNIYEMKPDGTDEKILFKDFDGNGPKISPDGSKIAFSASREEGSQYSHWDVIKDIFIMKLNGVKPLRLTHALSDAKGRTFNSYSALEPAFSPDGKRIAFAGGQFDVITSTFQIRLMDADGSHATRIIKGKNTNDRMPCFSPDGKKILYASGSYYTEMGSHLNIYTINIDGTGRKRLTTNKADDSWPTFSPDGKKIVFLSDRDQGFREIYIMTSDGKKQTRLTWNSKSYSKSRINPAFSHPVFSSDGQRIAFGFGTPEKRDIYTMKIDGTEQRRVAKGSYVMRWR